MANTASGLLSRRALVFLGTVTLIALLVHAAILSNAHWFPKYWEGGAKVAAPAPAVTAPAVR